MLSFLDRWDNCSKCEFDTGIKTEYKIIITMMENNQVFIKTYISKHRAKRRMFLQSLYCKKRRVPIYLTKTVLKRTLNAIFNIKKVDFDKSSLKR